MQKLVLIGWIGSFVGAAAAYPVAGIIASTAVEAYVIGAHPPTRVSGERDLFNFDPPKAAKDSPEYRRAVMAIYGSQTDDTTQVVLVQKEKFLHPQELPSLTLLPVDKEKNENPLQLKTVHFFAPRFTLGFSVAGAVLLAVWLLLRRRKATATPPPTA